MDIGVFTELSASTIRETGVPMVKKPNPVYMLRVDGPFAVQTNEGLLSCPDGYVAHDPLSGHVWPVSADYVAQHYEELK